MKTYPNTFSENFISTEIRTSRPKTLTTFFLRLGNQYPVLRSEFLKLIDSASAVSSPSEYFYDSLRALHQGLPIYLRLIFMALEKLIPRHVADVLIRYVINNLLTPYFLLRDENAFKKAMMRFQKNDTGIILDVVGEEALFLFEAENFLKSYEHAMEMFGGKVAVKLSSLMPSSSFRLGNYKENKCELKKKFVHILMLAQKNRVSVTLDAEEYFKWCLLIEDVFCETLLEREWSNIPDVGIALQAYRRDSFESAERFLAVAKKRGCPITVRVVKGAYWDTEKVIADQSGWKYPLFEKKDETDQNFDRIISFFLQNRKYIHVSPATHNPKNIAHALKETRGDYVNFEFQVLYGLGESVRRALSRNKIPVSVYCPLVRQGGSATEGLAYLVRRILENTAGNSCLLKNL